MALDPAALVNEHWSAVYKLLHCLTGNTHDTEDLTQETFLRALKNPETFRPDTRQRPWLLRIASNAFFDLRRKRQRAGQRPLPEDVIDRQQRPEQVLESTEQGAWVKAALADLSETTRLVFHLRTTEELAFRDIGELVGTSEAAARQHMQTARTKLMTRLAGKLT